MDSFRILGASHLTFGGGRGWKISQWQEFFPHWPTRQIFFSVKEQCKTLFWRLSAARFFFTPIRSGTALPSAKQQKSYPKDSTDFIDFLESPSGRCTNTCFNGCNEPLYEHTKQPALTNPPASQHHYWNSRQCYSISLQKTTTKYMAQPWAKRGSGSTNWVQI